MVAIILSACRFHDRQKIDLYQALIEASANGDLKQVDHLLDKGVRVNPAHDLGSTPLVRASLAGHTAVVELLVRKGADVNAPAQWRYPSGHCIYTETALINAAMMGHAEIVRFLLSEEADPDARDQCYGDTALILASIMGHRHIVRMLVDRGANATIRDRGALTAFDWAERKGFDQIQQILLQAKDK
jgi:ankyrin repeat protein